MMMGLYYLGGVGALPAVVLIASDATLASKAEYESKTT